MNATFTKLGIRNIRWWSMFGRRFLIQRTLSCSKEDYHDGNAADYCEDVEGD